jgi:hypothetical protein
MNPLGKGVAPVGRIRPVTGSSEVQDVQLTAPTTGPVKTPYPPTIEQLKGTDNTRVQRIIAKEKQAAEKAQQPNDKIWAQEAKNENAREAYLEEQNLQEARNRNAAEEFVAKENAQAAKNLNARDQFTRGVEVSQAEAEAEAAKRQLTAAEQDARNLNARDKYVADDQAQTAKNLDAAAAHRREVEIAQANAETEDAARNNQAVTEANAERQQEQIDDFLNREDVEPSDPTARQVAVGAGPANEKQSLSQTFRIKPPAPEGGEGGEGGGGIGPSGGGPPINPSGLGLSDLQKLLTSGGPAEQKLAAQEVNRRIAIANAQKKLNGMKAKEPVPGTELPPDAGFDLGGNPSEPPPPPPPAPTSSTPDEQAWFNQIRERFAGRRFSNKAEAAGVAKALGHGVEVKTLSPGRHELVFPDEPIFPSDKYPSAGPRTAKPVENQPATTEFKKGENPAYKAPEPPMPNMERQSDEALGRFLSSDNEAEANAAAIELERRMSAKGEGPLRPVEEFEASQAPTEPEGVVPVDQLVADLNKAGEDYGKLKAAKKAGEAVDESERAAAGKNAAAAHKALVDADPSLDDLTSLPKESQDRVMADLVKKAKAAGAKFGSDLKGQKGEVMPMGMFRLAGAGVGAAVGATQTPNDRLKGAMIGAAAGALAPGAVKFAVDQLRRDPNAAMGEIQTVGERVKSTLTELGHMIPEWQRFNYLTNLPNLPINVFVGPWGSATMGSLEKMLTGAFNKDPEMVQDGARALKVLFNPLKLAREYKRAGFEAREAIAHAEGRMETSESHGPEWFRKVTSAPGEAMTQGDVAAKNILQEHGNFSKEEAQRATLTSEPKWAISKKISAFKKAKTEGGKDSVVGQMMLPFYRTAINQLEQSAERIPGLGEIIQRRLKDEPDPAVQRVAQQVMGGGVMGASFMLGAMYPVPANPNDGSYKTVLKILDNIGGQYGKLTVGAFAAGQAWQQGKSPLRAAAVSALQNTPLPSEQPIQSAIDAVTKDTGTKSATDYAFGVGMLPAIANPKGTGLTIPRMLGMAPSETELKREKSRAATQAARTKGRNRYRKAGS